MTKKQSPILCYVSAYAVAYLVYAITKEIPHWVSVCLAMTSVILVLEFWPKRNS